MIYALLVTASPFSGHTAQTAARFAQCAIARGHSVSRVFFLDDGAYNGSASTVPRQGETDPLQCWLDLARDHAVELVLCISSALRRGLLDDAEAKRYEQPAATVHPAFVISGLGQLVDAADQADRLITFGAPR